MAASQPVLVVSVRELLDKSVEGKKGAKAIEAAFLAKQGERDRIAAGAARLQFEQEAVAALEAERARLRDALLVRARKIAEDIRKERKAAAVVDRDTALAYDAAADVTADVIAKLDA